MVASVVAIISLGQDEGIFGNIRYRIALIVSIILSNAIILIEFEDEYIVAYRLSKVD